MAKFRIKPALIPKLTERKVVNPETGKIKMRLPAKDNRITGEHCHEFEFLPTDVLETTNEFTAKVLAGKRSPKIKSNGEWFISDPSVPWFESVADSTPTNVVIENTTEIMLQRHRSIMAKYAFDLGITLPSPVEKISANETLLMAARIHHANKGA